MFKWTPYWGWLKRLWEEPVRREAATQSRLAMPNRNRLSVRWGSVLSSIAGQLDSLRARAAIVTDIHRGRSTSGRDRFEGHVDCAGSSRREMGAAGVATVDHGKIPGVGSAEGYFVEVQSKSC